MSQGVALPVDTGQSRRWRILQLHNHHAARGGAMEVLAHEAALLSGAGHVVEQYTLPPVEEMALPAWRAGAKAVWNLEAAHDVRALIARFRPDVVHVHTPFPLLSPAVFRVAQAAGVPAVATMHSFRYSCIAATCFRGGGICEQCVGHSLKLAGVRHACYHDSRAASAALTLGLGLHRALGTFRGLTRMLTLTEFARMLLIRDGFAPNRVEVKANSVPDPGFRPASPPGRRIAFVGRLEEIKGVRTLLDAWSAIPPGLELVVAGEGPLRPLVQERARLDPSIRFLGWLDEAAVTDLMGSAEAVVVPSQWYEAGTPLVTLRSLGVGTPVLTSDLDNVGAEVLADGAGWGFRTGDVASLAARLGELAARPDEALELRPVARRSYEARYAPAVNLAALERVYREVSGTAETASRSWR